MKTNISNSGQFLKMIFSSTESESKASAYKQRKRHVAPVNYNETMLFRKCWQLKISNKLHEKYTGRVRRATVAMRPVTVELQCAARVENRRFTDTMVQSSADNTQCVPAETDDTILISTTTSGRIAGSPLVVNIPLDLSLSSPMDTVASSSAEKAPLNISSTLSHNRVAINSTMCTENIRETWLVDKEFSSEYLYKQSVSN